MQLLGNLAQRAIREAREAGRDPEKAVENLRRQQKISAPFIKFIVEALKEETLAYDIRKSEETKDSSMGERAIYKEAYNKGVLRGITLLDFDQKEK